MSIDFQRYLPPGPIGAAFIKSHGPIDVIMGPGGSGKTVASCMKGPTLTATYAPVCKDGWVRVKTACTRDTYRDFARTALASWYNLFPKSHPWTVSHEGGQDRPVKHVIAWEARRGPDTVKCEFTLETGAPGEDDIEGFFKGLEITYGWANEVDIQHPNTLPLMFQRCGRFPPVDTIAESELERVSRDGRKIMEAMGLSIGAGEIVLPRIVWGDLNPPDADHPAYLVPFGEVSKPGQIVEGATPGWKGFWQPGGLEQTAENRVGKPRSSYELEAATTKDKNLVRRMVHSLPAYARDSTPVYEGYFNRLIHVADQPITPVREWGLTLGIDGGGSPAATIGQHTPFGQSRCLREVCSEPGTGPTRFGQMILSVLMSDFPGFAVVGAWGDPSAWFGADSQTGEFHWINTLMEVLRFAIQPAPSNEPGIRQEAVKHYMNYNIGNAPGYIVDPQCKRIIGGFEAHYKFSKKNSANETDKLQAVKNEYSHPHDGEQYRNLGYLGLATLTSKAAQAALPGNVYNLNGRRQRQDQPVQVDRMDFKI
jgi:hypothetical protein